MWWVGCAVSRAKRARTETRRRSKSTLRCTSDRSVDHPTATRRAATRAAQLQAPTSAACSKRRSQRNSLCDFQLRLSAEESARRRWRNPDMGILVMMGCCVVSKRRLAVDFFPRQSEKAANRWNSLPL